MTTSEIDAQFTRDMAVAGFAVRDYQGRFFYEGPAVRVRPTELQEVVRATAVRVQWDHLGKDGLVIYPDRGEQQRNGGAS